MKSDITKIIKAASVYVGVVVGAGFASGKELSGFFVRFGGEGFAGLLIAGVILALCGWAVMDICAREDVKDYNSFMRIVFGEKFGAVLAFAVNLFVCVLFCTMLSGSGVMLQEAFDLPFAAGVIIIALFCFITFLYDLQGIVKINVILAPLLVAGGVFFGIYSLVMRSVPAFSGFTVLKDNWLWLAVVYSSYNIITAVSVLSGMRGIVTSRRIAFYAGIAGGGCLTILAVFFALPLFINFNTVAAYEMPMLAVAKKYGPAMEYFYLLLLASAIITTAVANGFVVVEWLGGLLKINKTIIKLALSIIGVIIAHAGFSTLVVDLYPVFGYIGIFEIAFIIIYFFAGYKR